ncbi:DNA-binding protein [Acinetobacter sp. SCLZS86]|uniref:DNA-binding protein n=1 Tax=Acinetobacter sp. SCLZS86 TaxID=2908637 RepID=UPI001F23EE20|nr:DNA-binding protein [Acinetobacter sp. SCLZS86]UIZ57800.1 DNA-binding protein [Acinetobacter sp. SCLZS86]
MTVKTVEQVKAEYNAKGITFASVAKQQGWRRQDVYKVLNGQTKGNFGIAHDIAVFFGLKPSAKE